MLRMKDLLFLDVILHSYALFSKQQAKDKKKGKRKNGHGPATSAIYIPRRDMNVKR